MSRFNSLKPRGIDWNATLGNMIANTTTIAGLMTATPLFGPMGRLNGRGVAVSIAVGTALAVVSKREPTNPLVCYDEAYELEEHYHLE